MSSYSKPEFFNGRNKIVIWKYNIYCKRSNTEVWFSDKKLTINLHKIHCPLWALVYADEMFVISTCRVNSNKTLKIRGALLIGLDVIDILA